MTELVLVKHQSGLMLPEDQATKDYIDRLKHGALIRGEFKKMRNPAFHRKFFALLNFAFDNWQPEAQTYKNQVVEKNFDRFRSDIAILAGFGFPVTNIKGEVRMEAKSISFASMDETEFSQLFEKTITVIMKHILKNYTREDLDNVINQLLDFT